MMENPSNYPVDERNPELEELFSEDLYEEISLKTCVAKRISEGATGYDSVEIQLQNLNDFLKEKKGI